MTAIRNTLFLMLSLWLASCAQKPLDSQAPDYQSSFSYVEQLNALKKIQSWKITGRLSVQTVEDAFTASLIWRKLKDHDLIEINGMLGQNYATIELEPNSATLTLDSDEVYTGNNLEELMWRHLGFVLPTDLLTDWVKAQPNAQTLNTIKLNDKRLIQQMTFQQWQVNYRKYRQFPGANKLYLPSQIKIVNGKETLKLAVKTWKIL